MDVGQCCALWACHVCTWGMHQQGNFELDKVMRRQKVTIRGLDSSVGKTRLTGVLPVTLAVVYRHVTCNQPFQLSRGWDVSEG